MLTTASSQVTDASEADEMRARAMSLVNPVSGIANDYLNLFNEILMLVENYPMMPELADDILAWKFVSYREYFIRSNLPGRAAALEAYDRLQPEVRHAFETVCLEIATIGTTAIKALEPLANGADSEDFISQYCAQTSAAMLESLKRATYIVNYGVIFKEHDIQSRIDQLMVRRSQKGRRRSDTT